MNAETQVYFNLAKMYEFVRDAMDIWNYENPSAKSYRHSINMCILQIGEYANRIDRIQNEQNISLITSSDVNFSEIRGIRNRIAHSYVDINYSIIDDVMESDLPKLKDYNRKKALFKGLKLKYWWRITDSNR